MRNKFKHYYNECSHIGNNEFNVLASANDVIVQPDAEYPYIPHSELFKEPYQEY